MDKTTIYKNTEIQMYIDYDKSIFYVDVIDGTYNRNNFLEAVEYYKNFWLLVNNTDDKYYQVFIFNNVKFYPLEFYDIVFKTLKSLEEIFRKNLYNSCLVNDSNAMDMLRPLLNMYKAVRPFNFVKTLDEGHKFMIANVTN
uniref:CRAL-TRIO domain-containing protein n=1 Tax=viral metagenome TaxID=1070528 RepID=A0A6C0LEH6_9ZZZZ